MIEIRCFRETDDIDDVSRVYAQSWSTMSLEANCSTKSDVFIIKSIQLMKGQIYELYR
jgi:hypothetical protein